MIAAGRILRSMIEKASLALNRLSRNLDLEDDVGEGSFYKKVEEGSYLLFGGRKVVKWSPGVI